ncbi:MAG: metallophosphoesterase [candidate division Zixibacteria bacterium]|nr:metallophosphoesterase [candidate division Zixibacteria bacterium]
MDRLNWAVVRCCLALVLPLSAATGLVAGDTTSPAALVTRFAIIGDRTGDARPGVYESIVAEIEQLKPDFVVTVGDMIEGYTEDSVVLEQRWREYMEIAGRFTMPIYYTAGNNDITTDGMAGHYFRYVGANYYAQDAGGVRLVVLDNSRWSSARDMPPDQLFWLKQVLADGCQADCMIVFMHKPFWYDAVAAGEPDPLHQLFVATGVDAVFTGHYHQYFSGLYDGIKYTGVGSSGGGMEPGPSGLGYHFAWVTVIGDRIDIAPISAGAVQDWDVLEAGERRLYRQARNRAISFSDAVPVNEGFRLSDHEVRFRIENMCLAERIDDTLRWEVPGGWQVRPTRIPISLGPGETSQLAATVSHGGNELYPLPYVGSLFPYGEGKFAEISSPLRIARQAICLRCDQTPSIDGNLDESCWIEPITHLFGTDGGAVTTDSTYFYFLHDGINLFLGVRCQESMVDSIISTTDERDGMLFGDDCVGFFIHPDTSVAQVYQIYVNAAGAVFDQELNPNASGDYQGDPSWNLAAEVSCGRDAGSWSLEMKIPLAALGADLGKRDRWRINFRRKQYRVRAQANWQVPIDPNPATFGELLFRP